MDCLYKAFQRDMDAILHALVGTVHGFHCFRGCSPRPEACQLATAQATVEYIQCGNSNELKCFSYIVLKCTQHLSQNFDLATQ